MASQIKCNPCSADRKYIPAIQYCRECEEGLCKECVNIHSRLQILKSHHLFDLASTEYKIPPLVKKYCDIHPNTKLIYYCTQHDTPCCITCKSINHQECDKVISLDQALENVEKSVLLFNTIDDLSYMTKDVHRLLENRDANLKSLRETKLFIKQQIGKVKSRLVGQIDNMEKVLIAELSSLQEKNETKIKKQRTEISNLGSRLIKNKQDLDFLKDYGSKVDLYLALQQLVSNNKKIESDIQSLVSSVEEISFKFNEDSKLNIQTIGSIQEVCKPCTVKYTPARSSHAQSKKEVTSFKKSGELILKPDVCYNITDIAVNYNSKFLVCNYHLQHPKVYIYKDCKDYESEIQFSSRPYSIAVIPDSDTIVVTLPLERSVQYINTNLFTRLGRVKLGFTCWGITATKDNVIVGGWGIVQILDRHGSEITEVKVVGSDIKSLHYDTVNNRLLCRYNGGMCCVTSDGRSVYQYKVSGGAGLAVDQKGYVYLSHQPNEIHRLSRDGKFHDVVLTKNLGINLPYALTFNNNFTKLFVVNVDSVFVYSRV